MPVFAPAGRHAQTQSATITKGVGLVRGAGLPDCDICEWARPFMALNGA